MRIAVASGKGGTGKTTVALSLAHSLARRKGIPVLLSDCDVEAPNLDLFLAADLRENRPVEKLIPQVDEEICTACGTCAEVCQYNAILVLGGKARVFPDLCHGCGSCTLNCPEHAISEIPSEIGCLQRGTAAEGIVLRQGLLDVGQPLAVPVITGLLKWDPAPLPEVEIRDCPPGASCPVVAALRGVDYVLLVTEPTPFGLHDLRAAYQVTRELGLPAGVILNRVGIGNADVEGFCRENGLPVLLEIPLDASIGAGLAKGGSLVDILPEYGGHFLTIYGTIQESAEEPGT
jgi:MinD superfamily P-loop ATPase